jgi:hypothetical protein
VGGTYQVYANNGDVVSEGKITSENFKMDTSKWASGNYFVKAMSAKGIITKTFVIK